MLYYLNTITFMYISSIISMLSVYVDFNCYDVILQIPICYRRRNRKGNTNIKIHVLVHFTIAVQFYVHVNVE